MCTNMGTASNATKPTTYITQSEIDNMNELQFLQLMRHSKVANIEYATETQKKAMDRLKAQVKEKGSSSGEKFTNPTFNINNDGNVEFEYTGTKTIKREKGGKMQSETKADTVEQTSRYYGTIFISGDKMRIERKSKIVSEKIIKHGRL